MPESVGEGLLEDTEKCDPDGIADLRRVLANVDINADPRRRLELPCLPLNCRSQTELVENRRP
jgi:hypothetical protein